MAKYKQPKKFNPVSLFVLLAVAGAGYCVFQFGPPYWWQYKVKGTLKDAANRFSKWGPAVKDKTREQTLVKIRSIGIEDRALQVHFRRSAGMVDVWATYVVRIKHPLENKITTLRFSPMVTVKDHRISGTNY